MPRRTRFPRSDPGATKHLVPSFFHYFFFLLHFLHTLLFALFEPHSPGPGCFFFAPSSSSASSPRITPRRRDLAPRVAGTCPVFPRANPHELPYQYHWCPVPANFRARGIDATGSLPNRNPKKNRGEKNETFLGETKIREREGKIPGEKKKRQEEGQHVPTAADAVRRLVLQLVWRDRPVLPADAADAPRRQQLQPPASCAA